jgi:DNA processing protein
LNQSTTASPWARVLDPRDAGARAALHAWLALQQCLAYAPAAARRLLVRRADPVAALASARGVEPATVLPPRRLRTLLDSLGAAEAVLVPFGAAAYPERIAALPDAPPLLAVRGDPRVLALPSVAIVGARAPTHLGLGVARRLGSDLAGHDVAVVSGLARGIDGAAHRGALDARGVTIAVLGCGPDLVYPEEHRALAAAIAVRGAVVSELPVGAPPAKHHFPLRNRLISGLARAVVVVEARARSGSLVTARHAADQGREVLAVPGPLDARTSEGTNLLLRAGAWPALDASDVLAAIGPGAATPAERAAIGPARREAGPTPRDDDPIVRALHQEPATRDELGARLGWSAQRVARELLPLELDGRVAEDRDGRLRVILRRS